VTEAGRDVAGFGSVRVALADPTRRRLLDLLAAHGEATATALAERLPVSRQAIVKHLAVLGTAGLVSGCRVGREVRYALRPAALDAAARWIVSLAARWDRRLAAVKRIAELARPEQGWPHFQGTCTPRHAHSMARALSGETSPGSWCSARRPG
jgi:DNA-binding transcriptional ArsR family regulator